MNKKTVETIRRAFPYGGVVLSGKILAIQYPRPIDVETTEIFNADNKPVFENLIKECSVLRFVMSPEYGLRIVFEHRVAVSNGDLVYHQPLCRTMTYDELRERAFKGVPKRDIKLDLESAIELLDEGKTPSLTSIRVWPKIVDASDAFKPYAGFCVIEHYPPDEPGDSGAIIYSYESEKQRILELSGFGKEAFLNLIRVSEEFEIDYITSDVSVKMDFTMGVSGD